MSQPRTVYVGNVSATLDENTIRALFQHCGTVTQVRIAGEPSYNTRYCFVEFSSDAEATAALGLNGLQLADRQLRVSFAKQGLSNPAPAAAAHAMNPYAAMLPGYAAMSGIPGMPGMPGMPAMPGFFPTAAPQAPKRSQDYERIARTIHVDNVDMSITEFHLAQFFGVCGLVTAVRISGAPGAMKKRAWVEFQTQAGTQGSYQLDNQLLGSMPIRITPSKSAIHTNGLAVTPSMQTQMAQQAQATAAANLAQLSAQQRPAAVPAPAPAVPPVVAAGAPSPATAAAAASPDRPRDLSPRRARRRRSESSSRSPSRSRSRSPLLAKADDPPAEDAAACATDGEKSAE